jgi:hypothetical protein
VVVPEKHFVHGKLWMDTTSDKGENVASEEHFNDPDTSIEF